jgi:phosphoenolpyruvate carboxylase
MGGVSPLTELEYLSRIDNTVGEIRNVVEDLPTLRDQFAMAALAGIASRTIGTDQALARAAYELADAMMEAREGRLAADGGKQG